MSQEQVIRERVAEIRQRIHELADGRRVKLMAVTKFHTREEAEWAIAAGVDLIGENRVQEALQKWKASPPAVPLHDIGHLQTNKVKYAIELFDSIDSVDSDRLVDLLDRTASRPFNVMLEVNVGSEESKYGLAPEAVRPYIELAGRLHHVRIRGLMTVLPARRENSVEEERRIRRHMQEMVDLWRMCRSEGWSWAPLEELSMGMSGDWEWAVEAGATLIRVGTGIFGPRAYASRG